MTWTQTIERYISEGRTVSGGKGDHSSAEQKNADALRSQELQMQQTMMNSFNQRMAALNSQLDPMIKAGGMLPEQESSLRSLALNNLPNQFRAMEGQLNNQLVARGMVGGGMAGSGDVARGFGQLGATEAGLQNTALSDIQLQKHQQLMQALGMQAGAAGMYGQQAMGYNQGAVGALNAGVGAAYNADQAQTSWMGPVFGALGSIGGGFLSRPK